MTKNVANLFKELSRFRTTTLEWTILFIVLSILFSTSTIYAATLDSALSVKTGPSLRKTIEKSKKTPIEQQTATKIAETYQVSIPLHKVIVFYLIKQLMSKL